MPGAGLFQDTPAWTQAGSVFSIPWLWWLMSGARRKLPGLCLPFSPCCASKLRVKLRIKAAHQAARQSCASKLRIKLRIKVAHQAAHQVRIQAAHQTAHQSCASNSASNLRIKLRIKVAHQSCASNCRPEVF
eukprot:gene12694-biopygen3354